MKKVIYNPLKKWQYSRIHKQVNMVCDGQPAESEAHFAAFYILMMFGRSARLNQADFQTLLYSINSHLTLNYSVFGVFKANDNYSREQTAIDLSDYYIQLDQKSAEDALAIRNVIAQKYANAMGCELYFVDIEEHIGSSALSKFATLDKDLKMMLAVTLSSITDRNKAIRFKRVKT